MSRYSVFMQYALDLDTDFPPPLSLFIIILIIKTNFICSQFVYIFVYIFNIYESEKQLQCTFPHSHHIMIILYIINYMTENPN